MNSRNKQNVQWKQRNENKEQSDKKFQWSIKFKILKETDTAEIRHINIDGSVDKTKFYKFLKLLNLKHLEGGNY